MSSPTSPARQTGELLQVLSGGSACADVIIIATTNYPEAIANALAKRAGRFDAHVWMRPPGTAERQRILDLYLDRFCVDDELTQRRIRQALDAISPRRHGARCQGRTPRLSSRNAIHPRSRRPRT
jgi:SpoVK/Ycf46/Vps4 family AAA+-type ATPase